MKKRKNLGRKLLSWLLTLAMVVGLMPGMGLTAYAAANKTITWDSSNWDGLFSKTSEGSHTDENGITASGAAFWKNRNNVNRLDIDNNAANFSISNGKFSSIEIKYSDAAYMGELSAGWTDNGNSLKWTGESNEVTLSGYGLATVTSIVFAVTVNEETPSVVNVTGVELNKTSATLTVGDTETLTATVAPDNATDKKVKWSVGGTNSGAVKLYTDADCTTEVGADATSTLTVYAKGISAGSATVTATSNADSEKKASCDVTVNAATAQYYVVGSMNKWSVEGSYLMTYDDANAEFQLLGVSLSANDEIKVVKNEDSSLTWYPEGMDNGYIITADGTYNIHFRPDGQGGNGWHKGYIMVEAASAATYYASYVNTTTVTFNNIDWYIIADDSTAVDAGTVTLLAKDPISASKFHDSSNAYSSSTVKTYLDSLTATGGSFEAVADAITPVTLTIYKYGSTTEVAETIQNAKLWLLSTSEAQNLPENIRKCSKASGADNNHWWLSSPGDDAEYAACVRGDNGEVFGNGQYVGDKRGVRPALKLNLSSVIFSSNTFTVGSTTVDVTGVSLDKTTAQTIDVDGKVSFTATVAPDGATDKTVKWSVGGTNSGAVKLYTDADCTTEVGTDATETLTVYAKGMSAGSATITATSNADGEKKASCDVTVNAAQTEELLTTITATGKEQASYNPENVATVSFSYTSQGYSFYSDSWGWWGYGLTATVTPADGYTITKCVFYDNTDHTATDSEAPFVVETTDDDKMPKVNGSYIYQYSSSAGIKKIEVYGYATPAPALDPVSYMAWNGTTLVEKTGDDACTDYTVVTADTTTFEDGKWYVVSNSVTVSSRITVTGTVNLILCDGATLTASKGITVNSGNTINIYAQIGGTGELNAGSDLNVASIGGGARGASSGTVNIHGGKITATGGTNASGIGGALEGGNGEVNIYSGEVTARGKNNAAGIGGYTGKSGGTVNIYGGTVNASGSQYGTTGIGIGGIKPGSCVVHIYGGEVTATSEKVAAGIQGTVTIDGGTVTANGGVSDGIDGSSGETYSSNGINGTVAINGGTVTATGGNVTANSYMGAIESYGGTIYACSGISGTVTISGGTVTAIGGNVTGDINNYRGTIYACNGVNGTVTISGGTVTATGGSHTGNSSGTTVKEKGFGGSLTLGTGMYLYGGTSANPESDLSNYRAGAGDYTGDRYVYMTVNNVVPHIHSFTYTATGATITAACTAGCDITEGLALTISAPTELTYDGSAKAATLSTGYNTMAFPGEYMIKYYKGANEVEAANVKAAGDYTAKVTVGEATASVDFTIAKATPSIETIPTASAVTYGQKLADSTLTGGTGSVAGGFAWKDSTVAPAVSDSQNTEYDVVFTPTDENYDAAECKVKLTVNKADSAVTTAPTVKTLTYNGSAQSLINAGTASGGTMKYAVTTANQEPAAEAYTFDNTSLPTSTNAGTYYVWYKVVGDDNHNDLVATTPVTAEIAKAAITITADDKSTKYGADIAELTYVVSGAYVTGDDLGVTVSTTATNASPVNTYPISISWNNNANYSATLTNGTYTITKADLTVSASGYSGTYDGQAHGISVDVGSSGATVYYGTAELTEQNYSNAGSTTNPTYTDAGTYTVYYYVKATNYDPQPVKGSQTVTIAKKAATINANAASKTYGDADPALTATVTGTVGNDTLNYTLGRTAGENVDGYTITVTANAADNPNYDITTNNGTFTINKKALTITADSATKAYDTTALTKDSYTNTDLAAGDSIESVTITGSQTTAASSDNVPSGAVIKNGGTDVTANYQITYVNGTLTVTQATTNTVTVDITGWTYGESANAPTSGADFGANTVTYSYSDAQDGTYTATVPVNAGTWYVKASVAETADYVAGEATKSFTIAKREVVVSGIAAVDKNYDGTNTASLDFSKASFENLVAADAGKLSVTATGTFADEKIGMDKKVTITGLTLTGEKAGNYVLAANGQQKETTADVSNVIQVTDVRFTGRIKNFTDLEADVTGITLDLAKSLCTAAELAAYGAGGTLELELEISKLGNLMTEDTVSLVQNAVRRDKNVGIDWASYYDISLYKVAGGVRTKVTDLSGQKLKITMKVPAENRSTPAEVRYFYVVRVHGGAADVLAETTGYDVIFESDKFSTYALCYADEWLTASSVSATATSGTATATATGISPKTDGVEAENRILLVLGMSFAIAAIVTGIYTGKRKKEEE